MDLSIVVPAYNEESRLPETLPRILDHLRARHPRSEVIVVDDGSTDRTAEVAHRIPGVQLITHRRNLGKGAAVRTGMLAATGTWRCLCDADLSTPIEELDHLLQFREQADVIIASRRVTGARIERAQGRWKTWLGQLGNSLIRVLAAPGIHDTQCGFKLFHERTMRIFRLQRSNRFGYDFEDIYLARRFNYRVREIPVVWSDSSRSSVRLIDYPTTLLELLTIHVNQWRGLYPLV